MKKILFPTDFSDAAHQAFIYALNVADAIGASIVTLHVYELPNIREISLPHTLREIYDSINIEEFESHRDSVPLLHEIAEKHNLGHISMSHIVEEGETVAVITRTAAREGVEMIVMGTKGAGWLKEIFLGTIAAKVMSKALCPVLAIPKEATFDGKIDNIAITTDYRKKDGDGIRILSEFARYFKAEIYCVHVDMTHTESISHKMEAWTAELEDINNINFDVVQGTDLFKTLSEYLVTNKIDIVAMLTEKRSFWEKILHYDKAKEMFHHSKIPVLAISDENLNNKETT